MSDQNITRERHTSDDHPVKQTVNILSRVTGNINIKLIGIENIHPPPGWQDDLWKLIKKGWYFLFTWAALLALLGWGWSQFHTFYEISVWLLGLAAVLLTAAVAAWMAYVNLPDRPKRFTFAFALVVTVGLLGLLGRQAQRIFLPTPFAPDTFGIVFANLGEGGSDAGNQITRDLTGKAYEQVRDTLDKGFAADNKSDRCWDAVPPSVVGRVQIRRAGVMTGGDMARAYGKKVRAKLIIWGSQDVNNPGLLTVYFQMLETPDREGNPNFPMALPVTINNADLFTNYIPIAKDSNTFKQAVAQQSALISSTALGLASLSAMDYGDAWQRFATAVCLLNIGGHVRAQPESKSLLYFYQARASMYKGDIEQGIQQMAEAQQINAQEPAIYLSFATAYASQGKTNQRDQSLDNAEQKLNAWLADHPDDPVAYFDRGILYMLRKTFPDAVIDFRRAIQLDSNFYNAYIGLGVAQENLKQHQAAEVTYRQAIALSRTSGINPFWAELNLGVAFEGDQKDAESLAEYQAAKGHAPKNPWPYYYIARFYERKGQITAAREEYRSMTEVASNKGWAYGELGRFYRNIKQPQDAVDAYWLALHFQPNNSLLHIYLAETLFEMGDVEGALAAFQKAVSLNEPIAYVYCSYANALYTQGRYDEAVKQYEHARLLQPLDETILLNLGRAYEANHQLEQAVQLYQDMLRMGDQLSPEAMDAARKRLKDLRISNP